MFCIFILFLFIYFITIHFASAVFQFVHLQSASLQTRETVLFILYENYLTLKTFSIRFDIGYEINTPNSTDIYD